MCIINFHKKYVFVHIPKNAGGSIRQYLTKLAGRKPNGIYQHVGMGHIRKEFPNTKNFFSFAVVRNPWDRMWSFYKFGLNRNIKPHISFDEFLLENTTHNWAKTFDDPDMPIQRRQQVDWLMDKSGRFIVNYIIRYEDLMLGFEGACRHIKIPAPIRLPKIHHTKNTMGYKQAYSDMGKDFISEHFADDIKEFRYTF